MAHTLAPGPGECAGREPLFDVHPQTRATLQVFYGRPDTGDVRQVRIRLVLVASTARLLADRIGDWAFPYKLLRVSQRSIGSRHWGPTWASR
jgi:hypothetical protein